MPTSPTQRTLKLLRDNGWTPVIVEHWNPHGRIRQDYLGFIDIIAHKHGQPDLAIQATSGSNVAARVKKIISDCHDNLDLYLESGSHVVEVWGWRWGGARGQKKRWIVRRLRIKKIGAEGHYTASEGHVELARDSSPTRDND